MKQFRNTTYIVYEDGRVFNTKNNKWVNAYTRLLNKSKYERHVIGLIIDGSRKEFLLSRLLAEVYIPNPNNYPQVNHIDGNSLNNALSNLEWCTAKQNNIHAIDAGLRPVKLNIEIAEKIKEEYLTTTARLLAIKYCVSVSLIRKIVRNERWKR